MLHEQSHHLSQALRVASSADTDGEDLCGMAADEVDELPVWAIRVA